MDIRNIDAQVTMPIQQFHDLMSEARDEIRQDGELHIMRRLLKSLVKDYDKIVENLRYRGIEAPIAEQFSRELSAWNVKLRVVEKEDDYVAFEQVFNQDGKKYYEI